MKRSFTVAVILGLWVCLTIVPVWAQEDQAQKIAEGNKILGKMLDAMGGKDLLSKSGDSKVTAELKIIPMGLTLTRISYTKGTTKVRLEMKIMGTDTVIGYDGKTGWLKSPQSASAADLPEPVQQELKRSLTGNWGLMDPEKFGLTITFEGRKTIDGKECIVLKQTYQDGFVATLYVDPTTYLLYKTVSMALNDQAQNVEQENILTDYREVEGMKVPFAVKVIRGGKEYVDMTMSEYKFHLNLEDSLFERPQ